MRPIIATTLAILLASTHPAGGQETTSPMDKEAMRASTQSLGLSIGHHYACVGDAEAREILRIETLYMFDMILKDVGSDIAFTFATSAGYGASLPVEKLDCPALADAYAAVLADFGMTGEAAE
ncbi:MAG: hypothetical protein AAFR52_04380 [Pseudomonadota bacterium]